MVGAVCDRQPGCGIPQRPGGQRSSPQACDVMLVEQVAHKGLKRRLGLACNDVWIPSRMVGAVCDRRRAATVSRNDPAAQLALSLRRYAVEQVAHKA